MLRAIAAERLRKAKVAFSCVAAVFTVYGLKELIYGSRSEGGQALLIALIAAAGVFAMVRLTSPRPP
jgi:hypothetical protein